MAKEGEQKGLVLRDSKGCPEKCSRTHRVGQRPLLKRIEEAVTMQVSEAHVLLDLLFVEHLDDRWNDHGDSRREQVPKYKLKGEWHGEDGGDFKERRDE